MNVKEFLFSVSLDERKFLDEIKSSFPCWQKDKKKKKENANVIKKLGKFCGIILSFYMIMAVLGIFLQNAEYFYKSFFQHVF